MFIETERRKVCLLNENHLCPKKITSQRVIREILSRRDKRGSRWI